MLDRLADGDDFAEVLQRSLKFESFDVSFPVLYLPELIRASARRVLRP